MLIVQVRKLRFLSMAVLLVLLSMAALAQQTLGILRGVLTDESGALIPAATITITGPRGVRKTVQTQADGSFVAPGLTPGAYTVTLALPGFSPYEAKVDISAAKTQQLNIALKVAAEKQEVTVKGEPGPQVSVEPDNNAGALVLRGANLDALSDDPDDLQADLLALAGPAAGPNGGQIFIDGFSGGTLPPKENIREIRINQNPFSAEYDQLGYGRIEILTKPGTDKFHGSVFFDSGDAIFDARDPFVNAAKPDFISKMIEGSITGPLSKKSSFSFSGERRSISDDSPIVAQGLDSSFNIVPLTQYAQTPNVRTSLSPRIDYALSTNNTLVARYSYSNRSYTNQGVGGFALPSVGYNTGSTEHRLQATETSILSHTVVNETRLQYLHTAATQTGDNSIPTINVQEAFTGGGANVGHSKDLDKRWEIQNYTTMTKKTHTLRFGVRVREETEGNTSPSNFGGTFTFAGGIAPMLDANNQPVVNPSVCANVSANSIPAGCQQISSLQRYQRTLILNNLGFTPAQMLPLGGGATLFTMNAGNPYAYVAQTDVGPFFQDDWRMKPNLTISMGLRYETQTNISDYRDWAPRIGIAWAPGARGGKTAKTVIRGGSGVFYTRFDNGNTLNTLRFNGITEQSYQSVDPTFAYLKQGSTTLISPPVSSLTLQPSITRITAASLRAPMIWQSAIGIERQLPRSTTLSSTFTFSHGTHMFDTRDINAPLVPGGPTPYPGNAIYQYESAGLFNQKQFMVNVNTRATSKVSLFGYYTLNYANSDTDSIGSLPANQYNLAAEYGRSSLDIRHHAFVGGNVTAPLAIRFSPYISASSGRPFNITTGRDFYGDSILTDRPALAAAGTPGAIVTPYGIFNPNPGPNDPRIPRNYADGPGSVSINLRMSRTWGFGPTKSGYRPDASSDGRDHGDRGSRGGGGDRGGRGGPGGGGGMRMSSGGGGMGSMFGGGSTEHRYNVTLSVSARNIFNHVNPAAPSGNLTSPLFGEYTALARDYGPGSATAFNRRLDLMIRFTF